MVNRVIRGTGPQNPAPNPKPTPAVKPAVPAKPAAAPTAPKPAAPGRSLSKKPIDGAIRKPNCPSCKGTGKVAYDDPRGFKSYYACQSCQPGKITMEAKNTTAK